MIHNVLIAENGAPVNMSAIGMSASTTHQISLNLVLGLPFSSSDLLADVAIANDAESSDVAKKPRVTSANASGSTTCPRGSVPSRSIRPACMFSTFESSN